jgi:colanic acid biosynthesis glycosyl transferase WcaI
MVEEQKVVRASLARLGHKDTPGTRKQRLTMVCENYWPEIASTGQLMTDLAEGLTEWFDVEVLTTQPRYHGKYVARPGNEIRNGVTIRRLWSTRFAKNSKLGRLCNWFSFLASISLAIGARWRRRTLLFVTNPPPAPWAALIARLQRQRIFVLVHDLYPDLAVALKVMDATSLQARAFDKLNIASFRTAQGVIVLGSDMASRLREKLGSGPRIEVIPNWADGELIRPQPKSSSVFAREHELTDKTVFLYAGNLGLFQDLEVLIEAIEGLDRRSKARLIFVGDGGKRGVVEAAARRSQRVMLFDYLPREQLGDLYAAADVGLIALEPGVEMVNMPSKTYSILASGRPFLAVAGGNRELRRLADEGAGILVDNDVEAVRDAMRQLHRSPPLRRSMGSTARRLFDETYERSRITTRYADLLLDRAGEPSSLVDSSRQHAV